MLTPMDGNAVATSNDASSIALWHAPGGDWTKLKLLAVLPYDPSLSYASAGVCVTTATTTTTSGRLGRDVRIGLVGDQRLGVAPVGRRGPAILVGRAGLHRDGYRAVRLLFDLERSIRLQLIQLNANDGAASRATRTSRDSIFGFGRNASRFRCAGVSRRRSS